MLPRLPKSKHFQIERLADGVYAAVASKQGYAICNVGIVDIGDRSIIQRQRLRTDACVRIRKTLYYNVDVLTSTEG